MQVSRKMRLYRVEDYRRAQRLQENVEKTKRILQRCEMGKRSRFVAWLGDAFLWAVAVYAVAVGAYLVVKLY